MVDVLFVFEAAINGDESVESRLRGLAKEFTVTDARPTERLHRLDVTAGKGIG